MKILHTSDWHIGSFKGPEACGVNLRSVDTVKCLEELVRVAEMEKPELVLVSGDIFHQAEIWQGRSHKEVLQARSIILRLSEAAGEVIVMRGTPNHDSEEAFEELKAHFEFVGNVTIITTPQVVDAKAAYVVAVPGFDKGAFRAKFPGLSKEEENVAFTEELGSIVVGLRGMCGTNKPAVLMSHYTVPGCNTESGQTQLLTQFEPVITQEMLTAANYDLVALGHIHRPQQINGVKKVYYSGAINAMNFNDEGQERGFWIHDFKDGIALTSIFHGTPYREFKTILWTSEDIEQAIMNYELLPISFSQLGIADKIVRIVYSCTSEQKKALNTAQIERAIYEAGAFYLSDIIMEKLESVNRTELSKQADPETNLIQFLEEKQIEPERIMQLVEKARPIIAQALANESVSEFFGTFVPGEIEVKNYRNYAEQSFSFKEISFCTINGQNGSGKSSLFMDAIIDCLYEEPREGDLTGWIRKDEKARSGSIAFTFNLGEKTFRVVRTRAKSGKGTLNLSEFIDGEWVDRSKEKYKDTQAEIIRIIGMDSLTFKACVLIMQDQYGLFLEASKEERVGVLSNLLGLGIYVVMEELAKNRTGELKRDIAGKKKTIEVHTATITGYGKPEDAKQEIERILELRQSDITVLSKQKEDKSIILRMQSEAEERRQKVLASINTFEAKRSTTEQNMQLQRDIIADCESFLSRESEVIAKADEYRQLLEREKELIASTTMYESKMADLVRNHTAQRGLEASIEESKTELAKLQRELSLFETPVDEADIQEKSVQHERYVEMYKFAQEKQVRYSEAAAERDRKAYGVDSKRAFINQEEQKLLTKKANLERRAELLNNSGCPDIENANCRFLSDALQAKKELQDFDEMISSFLAEQKPLLDILVLGLEVADKKLSDIGYDAEQLKFYHSQIEALAWAPEELKKFQEREGKISLIKAAIVHKQSNISELEERLAQVKIEATEIGRSKMECESDFVEHENIGRQLPTMKVWIEKEAEFPLKRERKVNAEERLAAYQTEFSEILIALDDARKELENTGGATLDISVLRMELSAIERNFIEINEEIKKYQIALGSLNQKIDDIERLNTEILAIQRKVKEISRELADFDLLRAAFSQDGIPHQIIRSLIPQLTETANSILGQMTGGKMGIEFQTEKVMKNNSNKEVVTLDIFIEEYGKSVLPYLSKSGGEKVKASLSVVLALAEIKSSSAGIQLGMLFIDEPPFLDGEGIQAYCDALETIQRRYPDLKIMAITHDPTMKARFPQSLDIVKTEDGSKVIYE